MEERNNLMTLKTKGKVGPLSSRQLMLDSRYLRRPDETLRNREHGSDGENFVGALIIARSDQHLGQLGVQWELSHHGTKFGQLSVVVQR